MIKTAPMHAAEVGLVPWGDPAQCAISTISNYILMSYGAENRNKCS